jgi:phosphopantetheine adenylyltransferase
VYKAVDERYTSKTCSTFQRCRSKTGFMNVKIVRIAMLFDRDINAEKNSVATIKEYIDS